MTNEQRDLIQRWLIEYARYQPSKDETFRQPIGQSVWREWLRLYILYMAAMAAKYGMRGDKLKRFTHEERIYAIQAHNKKRDKDMHWKCDESADEDWTNARLGELGL